MRLIHDIRRLEDRLNEAQSGVISVFARATHAQAFRIVRALRAWNLRYYDTGLMYDSWAYVQEPDGIVFENLVRYAGFVGRAEEARAVVDSELDREQIAREVADG
jgi:hypothetical protein